MVTHGVGRGGAKGKYHGGLPKWFLFFFLIWNGDHSGGGGNDIHLNEAQQNLHLFFSVIMVCLGKKGYLRDTFLKNQVHVNQGKAFYLGMVIFHHIGQ